MKSIGRAAEVANEIFFGTKPDAGVALLLSFLKNLLAPRSQKPL